MKVKCINSGKSTQLFKDQIYDVHSIYNFRSEWKISLKNITGSFNIKWFVNLDGSKIKESEYRNSSYQRWREDNVKIGYKVVCTNKKLKTLEYGRLYIIEDIYYSGSFDKLRYVSSIKLKDNDRWYSNWNFKYIPLDESRELDLDDVLGGNELEKRMNHIHKDGENELLLSIMNSITDAIEYKKKTNVTIPLLDIIKKRSFKRRNLKLSDFDILKNINWEDLLKS